jgi:4-amino-4-deoxy-L-arabinose transferase-like glycosyltransferase
MPTTFQPENKQLLRWLMGVAVGSLALRVWIAVAFPITGDEAFFYWWGVYPDWGYYDHPPMVGWLNALMRAFVADTAWAIRIPALLLPLALGAMLAWALWRIDPVRAAWAVLLFWLAPINWLNALITTDTPLIFWSVLSAACLMRAEQNKALTGKTWLLYALSGLFLTFAFLSKYFSVVLAGTYVAYFLAYRRERLHCLGLLVLCALPGPLINLAWNMSHGWSNIMFNVYNRNQDAGFAWNKPLLYAGMLAYLITPVGVFLSWRHRAALRQTWQQQRLLCLLVLLPLLFFALLSLKKVVGLHWVLSFYPFGFVWLAFALPQTALKSCARGMAWFTGLHVLLVLGISLGSLELWKNSSIYPSIIRSFKTAELLQQVKAPDTVLMADAYTPAAIYGFSLGQYVPVFGMGKFHARQDDLLVDFSLYQGKTLRIMQSNVPNLDDYRAYFESVQTITLVQNGVTFYAVQGRNFNYEAYRAGVLAAIFKTYYNIPAWLPMSGCPFCERYCGEVRCPK